MKDLLAMTAVLVALIAYSSMKGDAGVQNISVPQSYSGSEGLEYIRNNYASQLSQAKSICTGQFKGTWTDSSNTIGCFGMQGFTSAYCNMTIIKQLTDLCNSIRGNAVCSSNQASCNV